jgi:hypothetical protein
LDALQLSVALARFCRKFRFWGKIRKSGINHSMTYRPPNSRKSNFATEPIEDLSSFITLTVHFLLTAPGTPICSVPTGALTEREPSA